MENEVDNYNIKHYNEILLDIYNNTLYLSRQDVLLSIEESIKNWKLTRVNIPLYIYLPQNKYGSEHYLYYHFQDILPKHKLSKGRGIEGCEMLHLNDMFLNNDIPSKGFITSEIVTIITCVISDIAFEEFKKYHTYQYVKIYYTHKVNIYNNPNPFFDDFLNNIIDDGTIQENFYPICLTYKNNSFYEAYINNDIHQSLKKGFVNIYNDVKKLNSSKSFNLYKLSNALPLYIKYKGIKNCSRKHHKLKIIFNDNYLINSEKFPYNKYIVDRSSASYLFNDINTSSDNIIIIYISLCIEGFLFGHANLVIINKNLKTFEVFEPHGPGDINNFDIINNTNNTINKIIKEYVPDYKFIPIYDFCYYGPQIKFSDYFDIENSGICSILCILYGVLRILNPNISQFDVVEEMNHMISYPDFGITLRKFNTLCEDLLDK